MTGDVRGKALTMATGDVSGERSQVLIVRLSHSFLNANIVISPLILCVLRVEHKYHIQHAINMRGPRQESDDG